MRGEAMGRAGILWPGGPGYDQARRVWNAMVERRPALIARCSGTADVVTAVALARRDGLEVGVRCGGPGGGGRAGPGGGVVIDPRPMGGGGGGPPRARGGGA